MLAALSSCMLRTPVLQLSAFAPRMHHVSPTRARLCPLQVQNFNRGDMDAAFERALAEVSRGAGSSAHVRNAVGQHEFARPAAAQTGKIRDPSRM